MIEEMKWIAERLKGVCANGLEVEVITWALQAMKDDPKLTLSEAFEAGCLEWDI